MLCFRDELVQRIGLVPGCGQPDAVVKPVGALDRAICGYLVGDYGNIKRMKHSLDKGLGPVHREHADVPALFPRQPKHVDEAVSDGHGSAGNLTSAHLKQVFRRQSGKQARVIDPVERRILRILEAGEVGELLLRREALTFGRGVVARVALVVVAVGFDDGVPGGLQVLLCVVAALEGDCALGELEDCVFDSDGAVKVEDEIHVCLFVLIVQSPFF